MNDIISRQAAIRWVKTECNPYGKPTLDFESGKKVIEHLEQMPSADRPQGWIDKAISIIDDMQREGIIDYEQAWEFRMRARMKGADDETTD